MDDVFGTPFGGALSAGWNGETIELSAGRHELEFVEGTRMLRRAMMFRTDQYGREWRQCFDIRTPGWMVQTQGFLPGAWRDGGTFSTYHGSEELALEWDEFDFSQQPLVHKLHPVPAGLFDAYNLGTSVASQDEKVHGPEYLAHVTTWAPDGSVSHGAAQVELFISGRYDPYGFV